MRAARQHVGLDALIRAASLRQPIQYENPAGIVGQVDAVVLVDHDDQTDMLGLELIDSSLQVVGFHDQVGDVGPELHSEVRRHDDDGVVVRGLLLDECLELRLRNVGVDFLRHQDHAVANVVGDVGGDVLLDQFRPGAEVGDQD